MTHCPQVWPLETSFRGLGAGPGLSILHEFTRPPSHNHARGTRDMASEGWTEFLRSHEAALWSTRILGPGVNAGAAGLTPFCSCMRPPGPGRL